MSGPRHRWVSEPSRYTWRVLERCAKCGLHRWLIQFENSRGKRRQTHLHSDQFDPWTAALRDCLVPPRAKENAK